MMSHGSVVDVVGTGVFVGDGVDVTMNVAVDVEKSGVFVDVCVGVEGFVVLVIVMVGVRVGTLGTQSTCPTKMVVEVPIQFPAWSWG